MKWNARHLALKRAEAFVQPEHHILGGQRADAGNLLGRIGRLAEERELQADRADVRVAIEAAGHVIRGVAMRLARLVRISFGEIEDLEIAIEAIVVAEADEAIDVAQRC